MIKKITLNLTIVILIIFILDFSIGSTLRYFYFKESSGLHYRTTYSLETTEAELLIFGASRANHHYVPEIFEDSLKLSYYNTGRDGNGIFYQLAILKSVLKRYTPKIIILDFVGTFEKDEMYYDRLSSLLPYYKNHEEIRKIVELKSPYERFKLLSEIYPFNSQILTIGVGNLEMNKNRKTDNKGYVPLYEEWQYNLDSNEVIQSKDLDINQINSFKEFIELSKKSGSKLFVIYSPIYSKLQEDQSIATCLKICTEEKIPFWNYSKDTLFLNNKKFFQDPDHLNHSGALEFSKLVVNRIRNIETN